MGIRKNLADASMAKISSIESRLSSTLKAVSPRREFVHGLSQRFLGGSKVSLENRVASWHVLAALIAGFVSLAVLLAMVARALLALPRKKRTA
jgi:hypothetical protein